MNRRISMIFRWTAAAGLLIAIRAHSVSADASSAHEEIPRVSTEQTLDLFWNQFLNALRSGSDSAVRAQCTAAGYQSFVYRMDVNQPHSAQWKRLGEVWSKWGEIRWKSVNPTSAFDHLGPKIKEHTIAFVLTPQGWKVDDWSPGD